MAKRTWILLGVLAAISLITWLVISNQGTSTVNVEETAFGIKDTAAIHKIFLVDMNKQKILLERQPGGPWMLDGKEKASVHATKQILSTLHDQEMDYPVAKNGKDRIMAILGSDATKVEVFDQSGQLMKTIYVGGSTNDGKGTFMLLDGAQNPYVVHIPGHQGGLRSRYFLDHSAWRDRTVVAYQPKEIRNITIEYAEYPHYSFSLNIVSKDSANVFPLAGKAANASRINKLFINRYLQYYKHMEAEGFENEYVKKDSILNSPPFCVINITTQAGQTQTIKVFRKPVMERTKIQFDDQGNPMTYDTDRYFALINEGKDFAMVQERNFGNLWARYEDFFLKMN